MKDDEWRKKTPYASLIGQRFGKLIAVALYRNEGKPIMHCRCDCGNTKEVYVPDLKRGYVTSCGCFRREFRRRDLTGNKFGRLTVLRADDQPHNHPGQFYVCRCDCGNEIVVRGDGLTSGHTKGCGCINTRRKTHGKTHTKLYKVWTSIKQRCTNTNDESYRSYGERGVSICDEWKDSFESFYEWCQGHGYRSELQIDRIDNDGPYAPWNCRFVTRKENMNNRRNTPHIECHGETHTIPEWSKITGISEAVIRKKFHAGWKMERILEWGRENNEPHL